jgi:hypothetical protein
MVLGTATILHLKLSKRLDIWLLQYWRVLRLECSFARFAHDVQIDVPPPNALARDDLVVFTAADSVYLNRFLQPFVGSMVAHTREPRLHVHLYNPTTRDLELLQSVQRQFPCLRLTRSHETFSGDDLARRAKASPKQLWNSLYICCSRFLAARALQRVTGASLLIVDIDILFNGNIEERFKGDIACALMLRPEEQNLSKRSLGGVVFASGSAVGQAFLSRACDDIARFLAAGFYWFAFDQYALYRSVQRMRAQERRDQLSLLTERDVSFDFARDALILYPKGALKDEHEYSSRAGAYGQKHGEVS